jgi:hypothetical protein
MQGDQMRARRLTQGKHTVSGALWRAELAFGRVINGHTILLPHPGKVCEKVPWALVPLNSRGGRRRALLREFFEITSGVVEKKKRAQFGDGQDIHPTIAVDIRRRELDADT